MDELITGFVGLDAHAESTAIGFAEAGRAAPRFIGTVGATRGELTKALGRLGEPGSLLIVYEAGPCGYGLARELEAALCAECLDTQIEPGFTSIPSVTSSGKVWVSPACKLAEGGNGTFLFAEDVSQLIPIYGSLGNLLSGSYTLAPAFLPFWLFDACVSAQATATLGRRTDKWAAAGAAAVRA